MNRISKQQQHTDTILLLITTQRLTENNIDIKYDISETEEAIFKSSATGLPIGQFGCITLLAVALCNKIMSYISENETATFILKKYTKAHIEMKPYYGQLQTSSGRVVDFVSSMHYLSSTDYTMQDLIQNILKSHPDYAEAIKSKRNTEEILSYLSTRMSYKERQHHVLDMLFVANDTVFYDITNGICYYSFEYEWLCSWLNSSNAAFSVSLKNDKEKCIENIIGTDVVIIDHGTGLGKDIHIKRPRRLSKYYDMYMQWMSNNYIVDFVDGNIIYKYRPHNSEDR